MARNANGQGGVPLGGRARHAAIRSGTNGWLRHSVNSLVRRSEVRAQCLGPLFERGRPSQSIMSTQKPRKLGVLTPRICIVGLWHQATVLSACFADMGYKVTTVGDDVAAVGSLSTGNPEVHALKLGRLLRRNLQAGPLRPA